MASAGDVTINFAAETAKFTAEMKKVRGELKLLRDSTEGIGASLKTFGTAMKAAFISAGIVTGIREIVKATAESEAAVGQLNAALKSASSNVRLTSADFQDFAKKMQSTTTFTDEAVIGVESLLLSFRSLSGETIEKATASVLDLSTRLGVDLNSAAKLVGRALEDPLKGMTALGRAGVVLSSSQKELIKNLVETGDKAAAQGIILSELEKRYGGAAEAARDTLGGALKALSNTFGDLFEGDKNSFKGATSSINDLTSALNDPKIKEGFNNLITAAAATLSVTAKLAISLASLGRGIGSIFTPEDSELKASEALTRELRNAQNVYDNRLKTGFLVSEAAKRDLEDQRAYIETLKERIKLATQAEDIRARTAAAGSFPGGHGPIKSAGEEPEDDEAVLAKLKHQSEVLDLRQKAITASINTAGNFLDLLDQQLGDGENRLTKLNEIAQKERRKSLETFAQDQLDAATAEFDRKLALEQQFTERVIEEQRRRVQNEQESQQQMQRIREYSVLSAIGVLAFLLAGHTKISKAIAAVHKAQALLAIYRNTAEAATKALTLGPVVGFVAAGAVIAFGALQAAAVIADRPPSSRRGGGGSFDSRSADGGAQTAVQSAAIGAIQKPQSTINVYGWSEAAIRELLKRLREESSDHDITLVRQS